MNIASRQMLSAIEGLQMIHDISKMTYVEAKAYVYSLMLFPEMNAHTERAYFYVCYDLVSDKICARNDHQVTTYEYNRSIGVALRKIIIKRSGYDNFFSLLATKSEDLIKLIEKRQFAGAMVGDIVMRLFNRNNISDGARSLCAEIDEFTKLGMETYQDITYSNVRHNIWKLFRPVAHLWAATAAVRESYTAYNAHPGDKQIDLLEFPNSNIANHPIGLAGFLNFAHFLLLQGGQTKMSRRGPAGPIFAPEVMHDFKLPRGHKFKSDNLK